MSITNGIKPAGKLSYIDGMAYLFPEDVHVDSAYCDYEPQCSYCKLNDRCSMSMNKTFRDNMIKCKDRISDEPFYGPLKTRIRDVEKDIETNKHLFTKEEIKEAKRRIAWLRSFNDPQFPRNISKEQFDRIYKYSAFSFQE